MVSTTLDGQWTLAIVPPSPERPTRPQELSRVHDVIPAMVPGNVELDLMRAGRLPDPYFGGNILEVQELEQHEWWYRCRFPTPERREDERVLLRFEGLDFVSIIHTHPKIV